MPATRRPRSVRRLTGRILWSNFWALPCLMILAGTLLTAALLVADARGASVWLGRQGWPLHMAGKTAQELASGLVAANAAFATLYFSITLLVLTLAAGNLGVRLIDRWISDAAIRFTLGLLLALLAASLIVLASIDPDGSPATVPRVTVLLLSVATVLALGWMASALHHLGRTVHVDTSIERLGTDVAERLARPRHRAPVDLGAAIPLFATQTGYLESINRERIVRAAADRGARVSLTCGIGEFMLEGEEIGRLSGGADGGWVTELLDCGPYRSDCGGPVFEANLLVEIAARALSPAVNDFYTALACCDRIAAVLAAAAAAPRAHGWLVDEGGEPRLELAREDVTVYLDGPIKALRHAAADHPAVAVHLVSLIGRIPAVPAGDAALAAFLLRHARDLATQAIARCDLAADRDDLAAALARTETALGVSPADRRSRPPASGSREATAAPPA